jgi:trimeric autotransporter adhesin
VITNDGSFTLAASTSASASPGSEVISTISVLSTSGYSGTVTLTCTLTAGPANPTGDTPTCTIPSTAVTAGESVVATVTTVAPTSSALSRPARPGKALANSSSAALALVIFFFAPGRRRHSQAMLRILVLIIVLGGLTACGASFHLRSASAPNGSRGTASGTYSFKVTGTGDPAVTPAPTTTFSVTVN